MNYASTTSADAVQTQTARAPSFNHAAGNSVIAYNIELCVLGLHL